MSGSRPSKWILLDAWTPERAKSHSTPSLILRTRLENSSLMLRVECGTALRQITRSDIFIWLPANEGLIFEFRSSRL